LHFRGAKEGQIDTRGRSSVEVEQILPPHEPVQDPRDFYACDSPVLDNPNSDLDVESYKSAKEFEDDVDPGVQDGPQASGSFVRPSVSFSCLTCAYITKR
jgi:hypothetical protein